MELHLWSSSGNWHRTDCCRLSGPATQNLTNCSRDRRTCLYDAGISSVPDRYVFPLYRNCNHDSFQLCPRPTFSALCGFVVFGITAGFLAVVQEHVVVICITAVCGGIGSAKLLSLLTDVNTVLTVLLAIVLSVLGLVFQFKPWKKKEYWEEEEDKNTRQRKAEQEHRKTAERPKKKRKSQKSGSSSSSNRKRSTSYTQSSDRKHSAPPQQFSGSRRSASPQKHSDNNSDSFRNNRTNVPQNRPATQKRTSVSPSAPSAASKEEPDSYTIDLSDIRTEISKEVQDIYLQGHHKTDHS